jgi:epoxide hydrolase-like predicted phosphatase
MQNIEAIIFDFGGVIFDIDFSRTNDAFTQLGVKHFENMYSQKQANPLFQHLEEGKINEGKFYEAFRKETNLELTNEQIKTAWNALLLSFRKESLDALKTLKNKYKLYLLSNTNYIHHLHFNKIYKEEIGEGSLDNYFHKAYYSQNIGYRKPDKEAYEFVLKDNNLNPSHTLFIDDSIQNIEGAKAVGLQTIFLKNGMKIEDLNL